MVRSGWPSTTDDLAPRMVARRRRDAPLLACGDAGDGLTAFLDTGSSTHRDRRDGGCRVALRVRGQTVSAARNRMGGSGTSGVHARARVFRPNGIVADAGAGTTFPW